MKKTTTTKKKSAKKAKAVTSDHGIVSRPMSRNLSKSLHEACMQLSRDKTFNGLYVVEASCMSYEDMVRECVKDGMTKKQADRWARDYACATFHLDMIYDEPDTAYMECEFNIGRLEADFKKWLLDYVGDLSCRKGDINLDGGHTEFIRPGAVFPR